VRLYFSPSEDEQLRVATVGVDLEPVPFWNDEEPATPDEFDALTEEEQASYVPPEPDGWFIECHCHPSMLGWLRSAPDEEIDLSPWGGEVVNAKDLMKNIKITPEQ
jgi:hypothetical protein